MTVATKKVAIDNDSCGDELNEFAVFCENLGFEVEILDNGAGSSDNCQELWEKYCN